MRQKSCLVDGDLVPLLLLLFYGMARLWSERQVNLNKSRVDPTFRRLRSGRAGPTFLWTLGNVCGVVVIFLFFGVTSVSSSLEDLSLFLFPFVPVFRGKLIVCAAQISGGRNCHISVTYTQATNISQASKTFTLLANRGIHLPLKWPDHVDYFIGTHHLLRGCWAP